jgi:glycerol-3-phosphate dehydrogenase
LAQAADVEMPIAEQVAGIVTGQCTPLEALQNLLDRPPSAEWEETFGRRRPT